MLYFDPSTQPKNAIPRWYTARKWNIPMDSNRKRSRGRIKAYDMGQGQGPILPLQSCTGREWLLNCMTVISAWWRLNIRFKDPVGDRVGVELLFNSVEFGVPKQLPTDFQTVETRCGREGHTRPRGHSENPRSSYQYNSRQ